MDVQEHLINFLERYAAREEAYEQAGQLLFIFLEDILLKPVRESLNTPSDRVEWVQVNVGSGMIGLAAIFSSPLTEPIPEPFVQMGVQPLPPEDGQEYHRFVVQMAIPISVIVNGNQAVLDHMQRLLESTHTVETSEYGTAAVGEMDVNDVIDPYDPEFVGDELTEEQQKAMALFADLAGSITSKQ